MCIVIFSKLLRHLLQYFWTAGNSFHRWNSDYCTKKTTRKFHNQKIMLLQGRINFKFEFLKIQTSQDSPHAIRLILAQLFPFFLLERINNLYCGEFPFKKKSNVDLYKRGIFIADYFEGMKIYKN